MRVWRLSKIPLSSIALNAEKIGYVAAKTLDQRLQQSKVPKRQQLDPLYIIPRQSTDLFISKSESINEALQFIQENSRSIKNVLEVSQAVGISRRSLEKKFQNHLGRTLLQQIHLSKLSNAQRLLRETHLPIHQIPSQSGFLSERQMNTLFRKFLHLTPRQFRQKET
jgi:LacI family transcriptional regulator